MLNVSSARVPRFRLCRSDDLISAQSMLAIPKPRFLSSCSFPLPRFLIPSARDLPSSSTSPPFRIYPESSFNCFPVHLPLSLPVLYLGGHFPNILRRIHSVSLRIGTCPEPSIRLSYQTSSLSQLLISKVQANVQTGRRAAKVVVQEHKRRVHDPHRHDYRSKTYTKPDIGRPTGLKAPVSQEWSTCHPQHPS